MDLNSCLSLLGSFGLYQFYVYLLSCVPVINAGIVMLSLVFLTATPQHRCFVAVCDTNQVTLHYLQPYLDVCIPRVLGSESYDSCRHWTAIDYSNNGSDGKQECNKNWFKNETQKCDTFVYDSNQFTSTVVSEVCDNSWQMSISQSVFYLGVLTGALIFGVVADRYGRQFVFKVAPIIGLISALLTSFAPNFVVFTVSSAVTAACVAGMYQTAFIIGIEFIGGQWRVWCGNLHSVLFAVGAVILCLMAYHIRDWRSLQFVIALPIGITLFYPWLFPESVRWQTTNGETSKAIHTIRRAAKWNGVYIADQYLYKSEEVVEEEEEEEEEVSYLIVDNQ